MTNRYEGVCENCGKTVAPGKGRWRMLPKQTQGFTGLRCKFCSTTTKKNRPMIETRAIKREKGTF